MTLLVKLLLVAGGGAVGSVVRYIFESHFHTAIVTAVINILGSFLMGLFAGWVAAGVMGADRKALVSALLMSGFCGGFSVRTPCSPPSAISSSPWSPDCCAPLRATG